VLGAVGHLASLIAFLTRREARRRADVSAAEDLAWTRSRRGDDLPSGLSLRWLGTAGFALSYQGFDLLIDPYLTRLPFLDVVRRRAAPVDDAAIARWTPRADAILVGHTHFDHALDVPAIARRFGCRVYGSSSLAHLMGLYGLADQAVAVEAQRAYEIGPFRVRFVPSVHSKLQLGYAVPYSGELTCDHVDHLTPQAYRCGQVWGLAIEVAGARLYHLGSADLIESEIADRGVDVFLCGISGRRFTPRYIERAVRALDPKLIVPTHYDDFFRPLDAPVRFSFNVNLTGFADEVHAAARGVPVHALSIGERAGEA